MHCDLFRDTELRAECQSSTPTPDNPAHEVHCVRGQCGTSSAKEGIGEVGVQHQEVLSPVFSAELASETESRSGCQSSRAAPNDSACEVHCVRGQCGTSSAKEGIGEVGVQHQEVLSPVFSAELASETKSRSGCQSSRAMPNDTACERNSGSFPSGQHSVAELSDHAHDLEPNVFSTDLFRDTELRAECQSSTPTPDNPAHEVHCVRGQCGTSAKEGIGEVGVQHLAVFSVELASDTESRSGCQSSRAAPNDCLDRDQGVNHPEPHQMTLLVRNPQKTGMYQMSVNIKVCQCNFWFTSSPTQLLKVSVFHQGGVRRDHGLRRRCKR
ncbi:hypothetical protein AALO_G00306710 [Alosa alosa]|uniref:Uncharacterized protein n=1 Tax=Alosa alosa TaxID=278164 RepID=A0AAV6FDF3_9TELE|nr:hypothetical protein AALO_G00306710 [Alosa alosa]